MRWIVAVIIAAVLVVAAGGIVYAHFRGGTVAVASVSKPSTCSQTYKLTGLRPSQIAAASPLCLVQTLKFSGEVVGLVGQAYPVGTDDAGPSSMCTTPKRWNNFPQALLAMTIGTKAYRLRIAVPGISEHQAVTINNLGNVVDLASMADPGSDWNQATGSVMLNSDGITGSIDASLLRDVAGARPVHVSGTWACGAPLPAPAVDASVPCASFYALNRLPDADVARMKAGACNAQSLMFSGDLSGTVDHAVTDLSYQSGEGYEGDNQCSQSYGEYTATMKFSIGDETFQLHFEVFDGPPVNPGQYQAQGMTESAPSVTLFLGTADPSNHGVFVFDHRIEWVATQGTLTIAPDMKSGTVDAQLAGPNTTLQPFSNVHVAGSWRCAA